MNDIYDTPYSREWLPLVKKILEKEGITEIIYVTSSVSFWDSLQVLFVKDGKEFCRTIKEKEVAAQNQPTEQASVADLRAVDSGFVTIKKDCVICNYYNDSFCENKDCNCMLPTLEGFMLSSTLTERVGR